MAKDVEVIGLPIKVKLVPFKLQANCDVTPGVAQKDAVPVKLALIFVSVDLCKF